MDSFTARGIVALAFSCLCGISGVAAVGWYGMNPGHDADKPKGWVAESLVEGENTSSDPEGENTEATNADREHRGGRH